MWPTPIFDRKEAKDTFSDISHYCAVSKKKERKEGKDSDINNKELNENLERFYLLYFSIFFLLFILHFKYSENSSYRKVT
jgi:hypothetical protein